MKILLLGGNGYVGSKVYPMLLNKHDVDSIDLCLFGKDLGYSKKINYDVIDVTPYDIIICLAGHSSVQMSECDANRSWNNNVEYFRHLCEKISNKQQLIYASSASVYGSGGPTATEETSINFDTINNYDMQKIAIDLIASRYIKLGKNIVGLRFGTVNGAAPNTRGELMINSMVKTSLESGVVQIKNVHVRRSILGINDLSRAIERIVDSDIQVGHYNLCSFTSTVREMAIVVAGKLKSTLNIMPNDKTYYDYEMSAQKFMTVANFQFTDTIESIIDGLKQQYVDISFDIRDNDRNYGFK